MRVLIAPDKFRGTFSASQVCEHLARGLRQASGAAHLEVIELPLADGGEGTLEVALAAMGGTRLGIAASGPLGEPVDAEYGVTSAGAAVIETARICGLALVPPQRRNPLRATSRGVGEVLAAVLDAGVRTVMLGLGGTAATDGGLGMATALGFRLHDAEGRRVCTPEDLHRVCRVDASTAHPALAAARVTALCDVDNPLLGPRGAALVFGPQKGASPGEIRRLELGLEALARAAAAWKRFSIEDETERPGAGAAGGLGFGSAVFLGARLTPGAAALADLAGLESAVRLSDLVITGEGSFDVQTSGGKLVSEVLSRAAAARRPTVVVAGRWDGTVPPDCPSSVEVITAQRVTGRDAFVSPEDLAAAGRMAYETVSRLASRRRVR